MLDKNDLRSLALLLAGLCLAIVTAATSIVIWAHGIPSAIVAGN